MQRKVAKYLFDIQHACRLILQFTSGKTEDHYYESDLLRSAVERQFTVIGEAFSQALRIDPQLKTILTLSPAIIAFRNRLVHGYDLIEDQVVWEIIQIDVPQLLDDVTRLLDASDIV